MGTAGLPQPGDILGEKYRVERVLGRGGMGMVVAARHLHLRDRVAIKLMLPDTEGEEHKARFLREARAAARIKSDHVARVTDFGMLDDGSPMIVMEYLEGEDIASVLARGALPVATAVEYVLQACEGVAAAHAMGVVHRDLKPSNIFLTSEPNGDAIVKILDFGISKITAREDDTASIAQLTEANSILGSPQYMSPEQLRGLEVDTRTDIWALGAMLFEMVTGHTPFERKSMAELCAAILNEPPTPLSRYLDDPPPALDVVLRSALEKTVALRCRTVHDLAQGLAMVVPTPTARLAVDSIRKLTTANERRTPSSAPPPAENDLPAGATRRVDEATPTASVTAQAPAPDGPRGTSRAVVLGGVALLGLAGAFLLTRPNNAPAPAAVLPSVAAVPAAVAAPEPSATVAPPPRALASEALAPSASPAGSARSAPSARAGASKPSASHPEPSAPTTAAPPPRRPANVLDERQ